jgi:hypothetical protein
MILAKKESRDIFYQSSLCDDPELVRNTLEHLLQKEDNSELVEDYMAGIQCGRLNPDMRKILAIWMQEVLDANYADCDETFSLSLNLLDRVLSRVPTNPSSLQLVGGACLLISSKVKEHRPLTLQKVTKSAGFAFTQTDLKVKNQHYTNSFGCV